MRHLVLLWLLVVTMAIGITQADNHDRWMVLPMGYEMDDQQMLDVAKCLKVTENPKEAHGVYGPVCGKDGFRYWNNWVLQCLKQLVSSSIEADSDEVCKSQPIWAPLAFRRNWWAAKQKDIDAVESCVKKCNEKFDPICGTDNKTYSHSCELQCASSRFQSIQKLHRGFCKQDMTASEGECAPIWQPVCGTNGVTYLNMCHLLHAKRRMKMPVSMHHMGDCVLKPAFMSTKCMENGCDDDLYKPYKTPGTSDEGNSNPTEGRCNLSNDIPMNKL